MVHTRPEEALPWVQRCWKTRRSSPWKTGSGTYHEATVLTTLAAAPDSLVTAARPDPLAPSCHLLVSVAPGLSLEIPGVPQSTPTIGADGLSPVPNSLAGRMVQRSCAPKVSARGVGGASGTSDQLYFGHRMMGRLRWPDVPNTVRSPVSRRHYGYGWCESFRRGPSPASWRCAASPAPTRPLHVGARSRRRCTRRLHLHQRHSPFQRNRWPMLATFLRVGPPGAPQVSAMPLVIPRPNVHLRWATIGTPTIECPQSLLGRGAHDRKRAARRRNMAPSIPQGSELHHP